MNFLKTYLKIPVVAAVNVNGKSKVSLNEKEDCKVSLTERLITSEYLHCMQVTNWMYHVVLLLFLETPKELNDPIVSIQLIPESGTGILGGKAKVLISEQSFGAYASYTKYDEQIIADVSFDKIKQFCNEYTAIQSKSDFSYIKNNCRHFMKSLTKFARIKFDG